jgi:hypothetical protein
MGIDACRKVNGTEYGSQDASRWKREQLSQEGVGLCAAFKNGQSQRFVFKVPPPALWLMLTIRKIFNNRLPSAFKEAVFTSTSETKFKFCLHFLLNLQSTLFFSESYHTAIFT